MNLFTKGLKSEYGNVMIVSLSFSAAGPGYYVSAQQGQVIMSVPSRARLLCQCPVGPGYYVSAQQGQVYVSAQQGHVIMSVPSRARYQCPAGQAAWQGNSIHGCSKRPTPVDQ